VIDRYYSPRNGTVSETSGYCDQIANLLVGQRCNKPSGASATVTTAGIPSMSPSSNVSRSFAVLQRKHLVGSSRQ